MIPTPSQTVGPFFNIGLPGDQTELVAPGSLGAIALGGTVLDGAGEPVVDALVEIWQADTAGRYNHPADSRSGPTAVEGFCGAGRAETEPETGTYRFVTVKPGPVPSPAGGRQAPHIAVSVLARGLLKRLATRIYFPDETEANVADPVLGSVDASRRETLVATADGPGAYRFDIHLQGDEETVFFDV